MIKETEAPSSVTDENEEEVKQIYAALILATVLLFALFLVISSLLCVCLILAKKKSRQKSQSKFSSPDILLNIEGNYHSYIQSFLQIAY